MSVNLIAYIAVPTSYPIKKILKVLANRDIATIIGNPHALALSKEHVLECNFVVYVDGFTDDYVQEIIKYAEANNIEVVTIHWVIKNFKP